MSGFEFFLYFVEIIQDQPTVLVREDLEVKRKLVTLPNVEDRKIMGIRNH